MSNSLGLVIVSDFLAGQCLNTKFLFKYPIYLDSNPPVPEFLQALLPSMQVKQ